MNGNWVDKIGSHEVPRMSGDEVLVSYERLEATRHLSNPVGYFETTMSTAAVEADIAKGGNQFAEALTTARNNPDLKDVYFRGTRIGKTQQDHRFIAENKSYLSSRGDLRVVIGQLLLPRTGRIQLDAYDDFHRLPTNSKKYRVNELQLIAGSDLSDDFKAIVFSIMYSVHTSEAIKTKADDQRLVIPLFSTPDISFTRLYAGGNAGSSKIKGFASYVGAYSALKNDAGQLLAERFGEQADEAEALISSLIFLKTSRKRNSVRIADIRDFKLDILHHIDRGELDLAKEYISELYSEEPELFTELSVASLFGENIPETNQRVGNKVPEPLSRAYMEGKPINAKVAKAYCQEVLGLSDDDVIQSGEAMVGKLFGVTAPEDDTKEKRVYDLIHFERLSKMNTETDRNILLASIFDISEKDPQKLIRRSAWRRMSFETAITMQDLGRYVELDESITLDDVQAGQKEYLKRLSDSL